MMSDKPWIGSYIHGETYPNKLTVYNCDFVKGTEGRATHMIEPWFVDRGNQGLGSFPTYEQALDFVRDELSKQYPMEGS